MTSIPGITRILARIHKWYDGHGQAMGHAEAAGRFDEEHKLLDEISNMLAQAPLSCWAPAGPPARSRPPLPAALDHQDTLTPSRIVTSTHSL